MTFTIYFNPNTHALEKKAEPEARSITVASAAPAEPRASEPITASVLASQQASIITSQPLSREERAFCTLYGIPESDLRAVKTFLQISNQLKLPELERIFVVLYEGPPTLSKEITSIVKDVHARRELRNSFLREKEPLINELNMDSIPGLTELWRQREAIIKRAFMEAWDMEAAKPENTHIKRIIKKYQITNPLKITRDDFNRMTTYEETILSSGIATIRKLCTGNLSADEIEDYLNVNQKLSEALDEYVYPIIARKHASFSGVIARERKAKRILLETEMPLIPIEGLTLQQQALIAEHISAAAALKKALATAGAEDDIDAKARLDETVEKLVREAEASYRGAFVDTPTDEEASALKRYLLVLAHMQVNDKRIINIARLSVPDLPVAYREAIKEAGAVRWENVALAPDLKAVKNMDLRERYRNYPPQVQFILAELERLTCDKFKTMDFSASIVGAGRGLSELLYYALLSAGVPERELILIQAKAAMSCLSSRDKDILSMSNERSKEEIFVRLEKFSKTLAKGSRSMPTEKKNEIQLRYELLYSLLAYLEGSQVKAAYLWNIRCRDIRWGARIVSELEEAEKTPEENDDIAIRASIIRMLGRGQQGEAFNALEIINTHIEVRKMIGLAVDEAFIETVLENSPIAELQSPYHDLDIEPLKRLIVEYFVFSCLEGNAKERPNLERVRAKITDFFVLMLVNFQKKMKNGNGNFALTEKFGNYSGIIGLARQFLVQIEVFSEEEAQALIDQHPLLGLTERLSMENFASNAVFMTRGYMAFPPEVRDSIMEAGHHEFFMANEDKMDIIWVPALEYSGTAAYATPFDRKTIVAKYRFNDEEIKQPFIIAEDLAHELQHKINQAEIEKARNRGDHVDPRSESILINEKLAYARSLKFLKGLRKNEYGREIDDIIKLYKAKIECMNKIIGLPYNDISTDLPDLDKIRPMNSVYYVQISDVASISDLEINRIEKTSKQLGYNEEETRFIFDCIFESSASGGFTIDVMNMEDNRHLFVEFLQRLLPPESVKVSGFMDTGTLRMMEMEEMRQNPNAQAGVITTLTILALCDKYLSRATDSKPVR